MLYSLTPEAVSNNVTVGGRTAAISWAAAETTREMACATSASRRTASDEGSKDWFKPGKGFDMNLHLESIMPMNLVMILASSTSGEAMMVQDAVGIASP